MAAEERRRAVLEGLAGLGYEVSKGMATAWVQNGQIVIRKAANPDMREDLDEERKFMASGPNGRHPARDQDHRWHGLKGKPDIPRLDMRLLESSPGVTDFALQILTRPGRIRFSSITSARQLSEQAGRLRMAVDLARLPEDRERIRSACPLYSRLQAPVIDLSNVSGSSSISPSSIMRL
ncbi:hypothetical protein M2175_008039 [Bradyrhizobium elkanii]|uniref:hypothetical protein n=1 Tax=Bradyrhizobium TaxID=374 RepID=UPI00216995C7|nr:MULTISPECIES: hypothetical protein [Bradyrhizobium]MCS3933008.1 hypothetical protein [Bradyrhizobium elkanii]MCS3973565.1 hypothetical protein [Bradyrhizobium japonicum]